MPEPDVPNFVAIAVKVLGRDDLTVGEVVAILTAIWNARGAADMAVIDDVAHTNTEAVANAILGLDR